MRCHGTVVSAFPFRTHFRKSFVMDRSRFRSCWFCIVVLVTCGVHALGAAEQAKSPWNPWPVGESQPPNFWPAEDDLGPMMQSRRENRAFPASAVKSAANYDQATATDPLFKDKGLWPMVGGKEFFLAESWPKSRRLVWAKPGVHGVPKSRKAGELGVTDLANWIENGKPATLPWDEDTDLILPPADQAYDVSFRDCGIRQAFRHITVGRNAALNGGGDGTGRQIWGNVWIKRGGSIGSQGATAFLGKRHTFYRNDNDDHGADSQYFNFGKPDNRSVEIIGNAATGDEFQIIGCTVILGQDSRLCPGRDSTPAIKGGTLVLMDGAYFGNWINNFQQLDLTVQGNVWGGLPERPLTHNCVWAVAYKNHTQASFTNKQSVTTKYTRVVSIWLQPGSSLKSHSAAGKKSGHLVVTSMGEQVGNLAGRALPGDWTYGFEKEKGDQYPDRLERYTWFDKLPRGLDIAIEAGVTVSNVEFDHFRKGGLLPADPASAKAWTGVTFGKHNLAKPEELPAPLPKLGNNGSY